MPRLNQEKINKSKKKLLRIKVFKIEQLVSFLECSVPSARLKLKEWRVYTSYNQNGKYYTLPSVPIFDQNGLWRYEGKFFSKHGNLKRTVVYLIHESKSGLSGEQIEKLIGLPYRSFLHHFRNISKICREKMNGVYIYFSRHPEHYQRQLQNRTNTVNQNATLPIEIDAIMILVALIKHHNVTVDQIMKLPEIKSRKLTANSLQSFFEYHGLEKKILDIKH